MQINTSQSYGRTQIQKNSTAKSQDQITLGKTDGFQKGEDLQLLEADALKNIKKMEASGSGNNSNNMALSFLGIGVMFGGIIMSGQAHFPAGIILSMCGGLALMSLANK
jgi:hypothetical protein